jgi:hypothetical protein
MDLNFYIDRTKSKRISILKEITAKGASPAWPAMMKDRSSFLCLDCGVDTGAIDEYYRVTNELWARVNPGGDGMLCIGCLEKRLGRELTPDDFPSCSDDRDYPKSQRLLERLGGINLSAGTQQLPPSRSVAEPRCLCHSCSVADHQTPARPRRAGASVRRRSRGNQP